MSDQELTNISPRIKRIKTGRGMDNIHLQCGKHKITVQVSNGWVHVHVGNKRILCHQHANVVDVSVDESSK